MPVSNTNLQDALQRQLYALIDLVKTYRDRLEEPFKKLLYAGKDIDRHHEINSFIKNFIHLKFHAEPLSIDWSASEFTPPSSMESDEDDLKMDYNELLRLTTTHLNTVLPEVNKTLSLYSDEERTQIINIAALHALIRRISLPGMSPRPLTTSTLQTLIHGIETNISSIASNLKQISADDVTVKFIEDAVKIYSMSAEKYVALTDKLLAAQREINSFLDSMRTRLRDQIGRLTHLTSSDIYQIHVSDDCKTITITASTESKNQIVTFSDDDNTITIRHYGERVLPTNVELLDTVRKYHIARQLSGLINQIQHRDPIDIAIQLEKTCKNNKAFLELNTDDTLTARFLKRMGALLSAIGKLLGPFGWEESSLGKHKEGAAIVKTASGAKKTADSFMRMYQAKSKAASTDDKAAPSSENPPPKKRH